MNARDRPPLSVVIPSYDAAATIEPCLEALVPQCLAGSVEVVVVDSGTDDTARRVLQRFPEVRLIRSPERLDPGGARNVGASVARSELLAFLDADCIVPADWVERVLEAHQGVAEVIGGVITSAEARQTLDWAAYFCSFHAWMPGARPGAVADVPTCCLSVTREAFERHGPFRATGYSSDTEFNWRVVGAGGRVELDPRIRVGHVAHPTFLAFARRSVQRGRAFARMRVRVRRPSAVERSLRLFGAPAVCPVLVARLFRRAFATRCPYRRELVRAAPWVVVGFALWSLGEAVGYARPSGPLR